MRLHTPPLSLTEEDQLIWWHVRRRLARRWGLCSHAYIQDIAENCDRWDADIMYMAQQIASCGPAAIQLKHIDCRG